MRISHYVAVLDACVLAPMPVADIILRLAEGSFFTHKWSAEILKETHRTLIKFGYSQAQADRRIGAMENAFPEALVVGYEELIGAMKNDPKDRHVLAAAVRCKAHSIITANRKHFKQEHLAAYDVECLSPDEFLEHQYNLDTDRFIGILGDQAKASRRSLGELLEGLAKHVPRVASLIVA
ncbi:MAG: PIN domain-containing protein [Bryobacteraceae bacterium]